MSDQTVRNAIADICVHWAADGSCKKYLLDQEDADMVIAALGIDPDMTLKELQRKNPCSCPIMTKAVYRDDIDWDDE